MNCKCIICLECDGSGAVWYSFTGEHLGNHRCDDLDILETCPVCNGQGIEEMCDDCYEFHEAEYGR